MRKKALSRILALLTATMIIFSPGLSLTAFAQELSSSDSSSEIPSAGDSNLPGDSGSPEVGDSNDPSIGESEQPTVGESGNPSVGESAQPTVGESDLTGLYPFKGMPEGFTLSAQQLAEKHEMNFDGTLSNFDVMKSGTDYVSGEVIFLTHSKEYADQVAAAYNGELTSFGSGVALVILSEGITTHQAVCAAASEKTLLPAVYPNLIYRLDPDELGEELPTDDFKYSINAVEKVPQLKTWADRPNDPYLATPNDGSSTEYQWMHEVVGTYGAWGTTKGSGVTVGVVDSGVITGHEDLLSKVTQKNFVTGETTDVNGHGTHVAGIVAATSGNGKGGAGIAPEAKILSAKVMNKDGEGTSFDIINGISYAADSTNGAAVINISIGGYFYDKAEELILNELYNTGIPVIVSAGNDGSNVKAYPAGYSSVIAVAATDQAGRRASFSNWGSWISVAAPGYDIWSTGIASSSSYVSMQGTSMASPVVAGVAALYLSQFPGTGARDINKDGTTNAKDVEALRAVLKKNVTPAASTQIGSGVINAQSMFNVAAPLPTFTVKAPDTSAVIEDTKNPVPEGSKVEISADGNAVVYTTDNTNPTVANGEVTNGKLYSSAIVLPVGKTTIKALSVNGYGNVGKVTAVTYTTYARTVSVTAINSIIGSDNINSGKSVQYTAEVLPVNATNNKVLWSITNGSEKATMVNGKLTIKANQTGSVTIRATSVSNPDKYKEKTINIKAVAVASVTLTASATTLVKGKSNTATLTPQIFDAKKASIPLSDVTVAYTSSNAAVATVSNTGVVTAVGSGTAKITCTALDGNGKSAFVNITVKVPVTKITNIGTACVAAGKSVKLATAVEPEGATNKKVIYSMDSSYNNLATLTPAGVLTAKTAATGKIVVTVTAADEFQYKTTFEIAVTSAAVTSVTLDKAKLTLFSKDVASSDIKKTATLKATPTPDNVVLWSTSNAKVATVDQTGKVTAVTKGSAVITAAASDGSGKKATAAITVLDPVDTVTITTTQTGIVAGKTLQFAAKCAPATAANKVEWKIISGDALAAITPAGKLTVNSAASGTITVRATAADGSNRYADYSIIVYPTAVSAVQVTTPDKKLTLFNTAITGADYTTTLQASAVASAVADTGYCNKFVWTTSNAKVATVNESGLITAVGIGSAVITATAQDGSGKKGSITVKVVQPVEGISISGSDDIAAGKKIKYTAAITSAKASDKTVDWSIDNNALEGVVIKPDGTLTVDASIAANTIILKAKARDGSNKTATKRILVREDPISAITLSAYDYDKKATYASGKLSKITLFTTNIAKSAYDTADTNTETTFQLVAVANYVDAPFTYSSSNAKVATVSTTGLITAVGAGSAVITCAAADGGSVKATVPVTVTIPASYVTINSKTELTTYSTPYIAKGTSRQFTAKMGATYGKPTSSVVTWDFEAGTVTNGVFTADKTKTDAFKKNGYVKISSSGLLSTSKYISDSLQYILITAKAADNSGAQSYLVAGICPPTTYLYPDYKAYVGLKVGEVYMIPVYTDNFTDDYTVTSSNPDIISYVGHKYDGLDCTLFYCATSKKTGTATIKITANDGTNKSTSITLKVG